MTSTASPLSNTLQDTSVKELLQSLHLKIDNLQASTASFETKVNKIEGRLKRFEKQWSQLKPKQQREEFCNKNQKGEKTVFKHHGTPERTLESLEKSTLLSQYLMFWASSLKDPGWLEIYGKIQSRHNEENPIIWSSQSNTSAWTFKAQSAAQEGHYNHREHVTEDWVWAVAKELE